MTIIRNNPTNNVLKELKQSHCFRTEKRRALTKPEEDLFLSYLQSTPRMNVWYPIFAVLIGTGLRVGEATGLRWCDIDLEEGIINVIHTLVYYDHRTEGSKRGCYFNINSTKTPGDKVLAEGTDYTLTYKDSEGNELSETPVNAGTYTVTVNGLGTYAGMNLNVTFTISPKAAELTVVADPSSAKYDGKSKTPEVTVKDGDKVLKEGTDYTLSYVYGEDAETKDFAGAEFVKEGNYTITVTGIGNYEGSTGKAVFTISKNNSASTDPTNPSNPNGDKNVTDKKVSNNTNNVKPVVKNVVAKNNKNVPKTGDNANVLLWIALAVISCGVLAGAGVAVRKRK